MFFDKRLPQDYEDLLRAYKHSPHCDAAVLHAPGICIACDAFPALQEYRLTREVDFTGLSSQPGIDVEAISLPSKAPDWAETCRPIALIEKWEGNRILEYPAPQVGGGG
jgi:hypothetical protein